MRRQSRRRASLMAAYRAFVLGIKDRDHWRCRACGDDRSVLDVHHIVKRSQAPERLLDPTNAVTLCRACHDRTDWPYAQGRLVITFDGGVFGFKVQHAASKFQARS